RRAVRVRQGGLPVPAEHHRPDEGEPLEPPLEARRRRPGRDREDLRREDANHLREADAGREGSAEGVLEERRQSPRRNSSAEAPADHLGAGPWPCALRPGLGPLPCGPQYAWAATHGIIGGSCPLERAGPCPCNSTSDSSGAAAARQETSPSIAPSSRPRSRRPTSATMRIGSSRRCTWSWTFTTTMTRNVARDRCT